MLPEEQAVTAAVTIATVVDDLGDEEEEMEPWNGSQGLELGFWYLCEL